MDPVARRLAALVVVGIAAFFSPLLGLFNRPARVGGFPLLPLYLLGGWAALIVGAWWLARRDSR